jgi:hypothetical protein
MVTAKRGVRIAGVMGGLALAATASLTAYSSDVASPAGNLSMDGPVTRSQSSEVSYPGDSDSVPVYPGESAPEYPGDPNSDPAYPVGPGPEYPGGSDSVPVYPGESAPEYPGDPNSDPAYPVGPGPEYPV